jgi:hypothetical protein
MVGAYEADRTGGGSGNPGEHAVPINGNARNGSERRLTFEVENSRASVVPCLEQVDDQ